MCSQTMFSTVFQVAAALLGMAFFYDIFWVFISPLFFKKSVMITVSTSLTCKFFIEEFACGLKISMLAFHMRPISFLLYLSSEKQLEERVPWVPFAKGGEARF